MPKSTNNIFHTNLNKFVKLYTLKYLYDRIIHHVAENISVQGNQ